ncbi:MAG: O-methyltransferase [Eubacteriales bacterium]|nr:O-methyltransferase [Eubacteriales bacterium]
MIITQSPEVRAFIENKYSPLTEELGALRKLGEENKIPVILKETEMLLKTVLLLKRPKRIVEIGTAIGYSAAFFSTLLPEASIVSIEKDPEIARFAEENLRDFGFSRNIRILVGDGEEGCRTLEKEGMNDADFLFIDAAKSHYKRFLENAVPLLSENALIASDNILQQGMTLEENPKHKHRTSIRAMRQYVDFLFKDPRFTSSLLSSGDGFALSIYHKL